MPEKLVIVADAHIWEVEAAFSSLPGFEVDLRILEHRDIKPESVRDADILLTRSSTRVNAELLADSKVRFAATATIGDDHYDKQWLDSSGIVWANAAGSSTGSVLEYMITALLDLHDRELINIPETTIGIIGAGRIGGRLAEICKSIGMQVMLNDPPRARSEGAEGFSSLNELLEQADLLTLHTPLHRSGEYCTCHLLGEEQLSRFHGRGIINAGRGACLDNAALLHWLDGNDCRFALLDCWENEPAPLPQLIAHPGTAIATPHIAGHSIDGKAANTRFIYHALCKFLHIEAEWDMHAHLSQSHEAVEIGQGDTEWQTLYSAVSHLYPILHDDAAMKSWSGLPASELAGAFAGYRRHYPARRAWQHCPIHFSHADAHLLQLAHAIGLKIV